MRIRTQLIFGTLCLAGGLLMFTPTLSQYFAGKQQALGEIPAAHAVEPAPEETPVISGEPVRIVFPDSDVNVDVAVAPGTYNPDDGSWSLSSDKAHFATATSRPNNKSGNTFIYGHNRTEVFSRLLNARLGDSAIVKTGNGHTFTYRLISIRDVQPDDGSVMDDTKTPVLTVQTCSGMWYENRRIYTYELTEAV